MHLSAFKTALHTSSDTCGGVRNENSVITTTFESQRLPHLD